MSGNTLLKLPQEIRDQIYIELLQGQRFVIVNAEAWYDLRQESFNYRHPEGPPPPPYAGLLLASKQISAELQDVFYKKTVFRAYLCKHPHSHASYPSPQDFARVQRVEIIMDLSAAYDTNPVSPDQDPKQDPRQLERFYREWFEAFGGSGVHRDFCRIKIIDIALLSFHLTPIYRQFLHAFKTFTGFRTVIVELGIRPNPQIVQLQLPEATYLQTGNGPPKEPVYAGEQFEALKRTVASELMPYLGHCVYYDRGDVRCVEFRPRTDEPIEPGCAPYTVELDD